MVADFVAEGAATRVRQERVEAQAAVQAARHHLDGPRRQAEQLLRLYRQPVPHGDEKAEPHTDVGQHPRRPAPGRRTRLPPAKQDRRDPNPASPRRAAPEGTRAALHRSAFRRRPSPAVRRRTSWRRRDAAGDLVRSEGSPPSSPSGDGSGHPGTRNPSGRSGRARPVAACEASSPAGVQRVPGSFDGGPHRSRPTVQMDAARPRTTSSGHPGAKGDGIAEGPGYSRNDQGADRQTAQYVPAGDRRTRSGKPWISSSDRETRPQRKPNVSTGSVSRLWKISTAETWHRYKQGTTRRWLPVRTNIGLPAERWRSAGTKDLPVFKPCSGIRPIWLRGLWQAGTICWLNPGRPRRHRPRRCGSEPAGWTCGCWQTPCGLGPARARSQRGPVTLPALLEFPRRCSMLLQSPREGRQQAIETLRAVMMRLFTSLPPGRVRFTILDPVGLGESFAGFMHAGDYQEALVGGRIWTEAAQIQQQLEDLTQHMENVIQKYLRNEFETIEQYNQQAGELAEPYRFLVDRRLSRQFQRRSGPASEQHHPQRPAVRRPHAHRLRYAPRAAGRHRYRGCERQQHSSRV